MLKNLFRPLGLGTAAALVAVLPSHAGQDSFQRGGSYWVALGSLNQPRGIVGLGDDQLLVHDAATEGTESLLHFQLGGPSGEGPEGWFAGLCQQFPQDAAGIFAGAKGGVLILHKDGDLSSARMVQGQSGRTLGTTRKVFGAALREAAGVDSVLPASFAELPDGSLILGYDGAVLRVWPADGDGKASYQWLLGQAPGAGTRGMLVAADTSSRVLAVDPRSRKVSRIDPCTLKEEIIATESVWPLPDFLPDDVQAWGDTLFVAGFVGRQPIRTLVALEPGPGKVPGEPGPYRARALYVGMEPEGPFAVTPGGHLALIERGPRGIRLIRNAQTSGEPGAETGENELEQVLAFAKAFTGRLPGLPQEAPPSGAPERAKPERKKARPEPKAAPSAEAQAKADAAFAELIAEETAAARDQSRREKKKAKKQRLRDKARAAQDAPEAVTGSTAEPEPRSPSPTGVREVMAPAPAPPAASVEIRAEPMPSQPQPAPPRRPSTLDWKASEFIMPDG
jgi:hypothetical protein